MVRISFGARFEVDSVDDAKRTAKIRIYAPSTHAPPPPRQPTAEEREAVAGSYRVELPAVDRLEFKAVAGLPARGQWRNGFDIADLNGDGKLDVVHGPLRKGAPVPVVLLGDGKGAFARWPAVRFPPDAALDYGDVAAADFNRDGPIDLALASHLKGIQVFVGDGAGSFRRWSEGIDFDAQRGVTGNPVFSSRAIRVVDWNLDGRPDVVAQAEGPVLVGGGATPGAIVSDGVRGLRVYLNQGDGTWKAIIDPGSRNFGEDLAVGDVDGDGGLDVLAGTQVEGYKALVNLRQSDGGWLPTPLEGLRPEAIVQSVLIEDLNADRRPDLVVGYLSNELGVTRSGVDVFYGRAAGARERRALYSVEGRAAVTALVAGDLDRDGVKDLVAFDSDGRSVVLLGDGKGGFARQPSDELRTADPGCRAYRARLIDLDGEPQPELVVNFAGESDEALRTLAGAPPSCATRGALRIWDIDMKRVVASN
jgi:hypothetical protein